MINNYLIVAYVVNFILLAVATYTDIKTREIPHWITILMLIINLPLGYYLFGFEAIWAFIATLILCLILGIGMGGGDIKLFTVLAPIFLFAGTFFYVPKAILFLIGISAASAAFYPMLKIFKTYWKDILSSSCYLATILGIIYYFLYYYNVPYGTLFVWAYIILSIFISRKIKGYKEFTKKLSILAPFYLIGLYIFDNNYFVHGNVLLNFIVYIVELSLISIVIYALTGIEISEKKKITDLEEGDLLRDYIVINGENIKVESASIFKRFKLMVDNELGKNEDKKNNKKIIMTDGEGLYKEDLELIKKLYNEGKIKTNEINLITTYPFVPFVLFGYVLVLILHYFFNLF